MTGVESFIATYPLGAGLGRWGMMRYYFGDEKNKSSPLIWAEIQLPAWLLDGGLVLVVLYGGALLRTMRYEVKLAREIKDPQLQLNVPLILSANIGVIALIFSYCPFAGQMGMQYWFLAGTLHGAARAAKRLL